MTPGNALPGERIEGEEHVHCDGDDDDGEVERLRRKQARAITVEKNKRARREALMWREQHQLELQQREQQQLQREPVVLASPRGDHPGHQNGQDCVPFVSRNTKEATHQQQQQQQQQPEGATSNVSKQSPLVCQQTNGRAADGEEDHQCCFSNTDALTAVHPPLARSFHQQQQQLQQPDGTLSNVSKQSPLVCQQTNGRAADGEEDHQCCFSNTDALTAVHPPLAQSPPAQEQTPEQQFNLRLQRLAMPILTVPTKFFTPALVEGYVKLLQTRSEALIPQFASTTHLRRRLHKDKQRFIDLLQCAEWQGLEAACSLSIAEANAKVTALRLQCALELELEPDFLDFVGAMGRPWKSLRLAEQDDAEDDESADDEEQVHDDDDHYDAYDDDECDDCDDDDDDGG
jgi:hypothetical protein